MKTNWATSSCRVMVLSQRRTVGEALRMAGFRTGLGAGGAGRLVAGNAASASISVQARRREGNATTSVCQIHRLLAREGGAPPCVEGGLRGAARLTRRFTQRTRWTASLELFAR